MHFPLKGIGKFYVYVKLVLRDEEVEEVNFYSFVVVVVVSFFAFLGNAVMGEGQGVLWRLPIYIAVLLIFKKRLIRYGIMVFYINCLTTLIGGKFYNFIADMYSRSKCVIIIGQTNLTITKANDKDASFPHCYLPYI